MSVPLYTRNESFVYAHTLENQECKRSDTHRFIVEMIFTLLMVTTQSTYARSSPYVTKIKPSSSLSHQCLF